MSCSPAPGARLCPVASRSSKTPRAPARSRAFSMGGSFNSSGILEEGTMNMTAHAIENLTLNITQEIHVRASLDATFAALREEIGPHNEGAEGKPVPMKIARWPGGRWYRNLGSGAGHFWEQVQAIKRPPLLEITGPLFMSCPAVSNGQYRLSEAHGGTLIKFRNTALGLACRRAGAAS